MFRVVVHEQSMLTIARQEYEDGTEVVFQLLRYHHLAKVGICLYLYLWIIQLSSSFEMTGTKDQWEMTGPIFPHKRAMIAFDRVAIKQNNNWVLEAVGTSCYLSHHESKIFSWSRPSRELESSVLPDGWSTSVEVPTGNCLETVAKVWSHVYVHIATNKSG